MTLAVNSKENHGLKRAAGKEDDERSGGLPSEEVAIGAAGGKHVGDAVFGDLEDGPDYRGLSFWGAVVILIKTQLGVGVLSFPFTLQIFGMVPGLILFVVIALLASWSGYVIGQFKRRHPELYGMDDMGYIMFGTIGRHIFSLAFLVCFIIVCGLGILSVSTALNGVSAHGTCTAVFVGITAAVVFVVASIQTLGRLSWLSWIGCFSIIAAILTLAVASGVQDRPAAAPKTGPWDKDLHITASPRVVDAFAGLGTMIYTVAGVPSYIQVVSEMRQPELYERAVIICQSVLITINVVIGTVLYYYCGQYVTSPAPGSAGPLLKQITYGIAIPGVFMGVILCVHVLSKYIFVKCMSNSPHLAAHTWQHWTAWLSCTLVVTVIAYVIASAIPVFSVLSALGGSFLAPWVCCQPYGMLWLYDNWRPKAERDTRFWIRASLPIFIIVAGTFIQVSGTYGSIVQVIESFEDSRNKPWGCADNSGST